MKTVEERAEVKFPNSTACLVVSNRPFALSTDILDDLLGGGPRLKCSYMC